MDTIQFTAPVDNNNEDWKMKKNYGPAALCTVLLLGMAFLAGNCYASYGRNPPTGSVSAVGGLSTLGVSTRKPIQLPWEEEIIPVEVIAPQALPLEQLEATVTEAVLRTFNWDPAYNLDVHTTGTTKTECVESYNADFVACYDATLTIASDVIAISMLKDWLELGVDQDYIFVSSNTEGYPNVQVKNKTPYPAAHAEEDSWGDGLANAGVAYEQFFCSKEDILEDIAPGDTWTSTTPRGLCSVGAISVHLTLPDDSRLTCAHYPSYGTSYNLYSIIMDGVDGCCVTTNIVCD